MLLLGDHNTFNSIVRYLHKLLIATSNSHRQSKLHLTRKLVFSIPLKLSLYFAEKNKIKETKSSPQKFLSKPSVLNERFRGRLTRDFVTKNQGGSSWLGVTNFSVHRKTKFVSLSPLKKVNEDVLK